MLIPLTWESKTTPSSDVLALGRRETGPSHILQWSLWPLFTKKEASLLDRSLSTAEKKARRESATRRRELKKDLLSLTMISLEEPLRSIDRLESTLKSWSSPVWRSWIFATKSRLATADSSKLMDLKLVLLSQQALLWTTSLLTGPQTSETRLFLSMTMLWRSITVPMFRDSWLIVPSLLLSTLNTTTWFKQWMRLLRLVFNTPVLMQDLVRSVRKSKKLWNLLKLRLVTRLSQSSLSKTYAVTLLVATTSTLANPFLSWKETTMWRWKKESNTLSRLLDLLARVLSRMMWTVLTTCWSSTGKNSQFATKRLSNFCTQSRKNTVLLPSAESGLKSTSQDILCPSTL